jgi:hypothetical protein
MIIWSIENFEKTEKNSPKNNFLSASGSWYYAYEALSPMRKPHYSLAIAVLCLFAKSAHTNQSHLTRSAESNTAEHPNLAMGAWKSAMKIRA